jgi:hypothetical protein
MRFVPKRMKTVNVEISRAAAPHSKAIDGRKRSITMGDKGGKKDKNKTQKQKVVKQEQQVQKKQEKQPKSTP